MIVVADAGPLIALAKIDALDALSLYPSILIPPAVYREAIAPDREPQAPDALALEAHVRDRALEVTAAPAAALPVEARLGRGELEAIGLAIERRATWLLVDDLAARRAAESSFQAARVSTRIKGTLGILVSAVREGRLPTRRAIDLVTAIGERPDIWVHRSLCEKVIRTLRGEERDLDS